VLLTTYSETINADTDSTNTLYLLPATYDRPANGVQPVQEFKIDFDIVQGFGDTSDTGPEDSQITTRKIEMISNDCNDGIFVMHVAVYQQWDTENGNFISGTVNFEVVADLSQYMAPDASGQLVFDALKDFGPQSRGIPPTEVEVTGETLGLEDFRYSDVPDYFYLNTVCGGGCTALVRDCRPDRDFDLLVGTGKEDDGGVLGVNFIEKMGQGNITIVKTEPQTVVSEPPEPVPDDSGRSFSYEYGGFALDDKTGEVYISRLTIAGNTALLTSRVILKTYFSSDSGTTVWQEFVTADDSMQQGHDFGEGRQFLQGLAFDSVCSGELFMSTGSSILAMQPDGNVSVYRDNGPSFPLGEVIALSFGYDITNTEHGDPRFFYAVDEGFKQVFGYRYSSEKLPPRETSGSVEYESIMLIGSVCGAVLALALFSHKYARSKLDFDPKAPKKGGSMRSSESKDAGSAGGGGFLGIFNWGRGSEDAQKLERDSQKDPLLDEQDPQDSSERGSLSCASEVHSGESSISANLNKTLTWSLNMVLRKNKHNQYTYSKPSDQHSVRSSSTKNTGAVKDADGTTLDTDTDPSVSTFSDASSFRPHRKVNKRASKFHGESFDMDRIWYRDCMIDPTNLQLGPAFASGSEGYIHRGYFREKLVAIKQICLDSHKSLEEQEIFNEADLMSKISHPHIVEFYGCSVCDGRLYVVMELCKGSLLSVVDARGTQRPNASVMLTLLCQIADSLAFLHSHNIVHRDLKPANILIDCKNRVKITDFGISRIMQNQTWGMTIMRGTPQYMAPELMKSSSDDFCQASKSVDVYSFALVAYALITGEHPFVREGYTMHDLFVGVPTGLRPVFPDPTKSSAVDIEAFTKQFSCSYLSLELITLVQNSWKGDPRARPPFSEIAASLKAMKTAVVEAEREKRHAGRSNQSPPSNIAPPQPQFDFDRFTENKTPTYSSDEKTKGSSGNEETNDASQVYSGMPPAVLESDRSAFTNRVQHERDMMQVVRSQRQAAIQKNGIAMLPATDALAPNALSRLSKRGDVAPRRKTSSFASVVYDDDATGSNIDGSFDDLSFLISMEPGE
jgi:serine/threonine protein kinase